MIFKVMNTMVMTVLTMMMIVTVMIMVTVMKMVTVMIMVTEMIMVTVMIEVASRRPPRVILRGTDNKSCLHSPPISLSPLFLSLEIEK